MPNITPIYSKTTVPPVALDLTSLQAQVIDKLTHKNIEPGSGWFCDLIGRQANQDDQVELLDLVLLGLLRVTPASGRHWLEMTPLAQEMNPRFGK